MLPETIAIQNLEISPGTTQISASNKVMRWLSDPFQDQLLEAGMTKEEIIHHHPIIMGKDATLQGHSENIAEAGARLGLTRDDLIAFENHDAEEAYLVNDGRISDYQTGTKTKKIRIIEEERTRFMFEQVDITGKRQDGIIKTIKKEGLAGKMLATEEYKGFLAQGRYFDTWIKNYSQIPEPSPVMSLYIANMRQLRREITLQINNLKM
jgi:hypothetical protein